MAVLLAAVLHAVAGFIFIPKAIEKRILRLANEELGRNLRIQSIEVNPYVLSLRIRGFELDDTDGTRLVAFDELYANLQVSSLLRRALTLRELRLVALELHEERLKTDESRFSRLVNDLQSLGDESSTDDQGGLPRLLIRDFRLERGRAEVIDNVPGTPVHLQTGPIDVAIHELTTLPRKDGTQRVSITLPQGASVHWEGSLSIAPLSSAGNFALENLHLDELDAYLRDHTAINDVEAILSSDFNYRVSFDPTLGLELELDQLNVELSSVKVTALEPSTEIVKVQAVMLERGSLLNSDRRLHFDEIRIEDLWTKAWLDPAGELSFAYIFPRDMATTSDDSSQRPWSLTADLVTVRGGEGELVDERLDPPGRISLSQLRLDLVELDTSSTENMPLRVASKVNESGAIEVEGELGLGSSVSFAGTVRLDEIPVSLGEPYAQQVARVSIDGGALHGEIDLIADLESLNARGSVEVTDLALSDDVDGEGLVGWNRLSVDRFEFDTGRMQLQIARLALDRPFARFIVFENHETNLGTLVKEPAEAAENDPNQSLGELVIDRIEVTDGSLDFTDHSLPLPFATKIAALGGTISTIETSSTEPARIELEGQVGDFGLARISGEILALDPLRQTQLSLELRNLLMSDLSPYTVQFAGRAIAEGKLDLELFYSLDQGKLQGDNDIVVRDLVLGDKVDHPDAANLPLGLAVALLKDSQGVIDIDLPVEGNIYDPEFKIGGVVRTAITGLIAKTVSAPFRLLGRLIGVESDALGEIQFLAGRSDLTPPELEKITQLQTALAERPEISIEIAGGSVPSVDTPALAQTWLKSLLGEMRGGTDEATLDDESIARLESLLVERSPQTVLETIESEYRRPGEGEQSTVDRLAYAARLEAEILTTHPIVESDLIKLAGARAESIRFALLANGLLAEERVQLVDDLRGESDDGEWIKVTLGVTIGRRATASP